MTQGELEARILNGERAQAAAPPDVSGQLRVTAQAEADAWRQTADAAAAHDQPAVSNARTRARQLAAETIRLEAMNATYESWSDRTNTVRETTAQAKPELGRRGQMQPAEQPSTMAGWWRQFEADLGAMDRAIEREHQAAIAAGQPWPPQHTAQAPAACAEAAAVIARLQHRRYLREPGTDPEIPSPGPRRAGLRSTRSPAWVRRPAGPPGRDAGPRGPGCAPYRGRQRRPGSPRTIHRPPRTPSPRPSRTGSRTPDRSLRRIRNGAIDQAAGRRPQRPDRKRYRAEPARRSRCPSCIIRSK
jgi:hypothetical protein